KNVGQQQHQSLKIGRTEFADGNEITPQDSTLETLKRDRIAQRLIGNFGFTHVGRSFDGAQYVYDDSKTNITILGVRPTRGVYQVDGSGDLRINVVYAAVTHEISNRQGPAEWRVFGIAYNDRRKGVLKTDNRPLSARSQDNANLNLGTVGGHYLRVVQKSSGN